MSAATITVTNTNSSGAGSLSQAIYDSVSGDIINFDPSLAGQTITLTGNLVISKNLIIDGSGLSSQVTISGGHIGHLEVPSGVAATISNLTITDGNYGILSNGDLTVINSTLKNNSNYLGGAVSSYNGSLRIENSTITQNRAYYSGGAIFVGGVGSASIINSTIFQNQADLTGGGIYIQENVTVQIINSTFAMNSAPSGGEIVVRNTATLALYNSIFACAPTNTSCYDYSPSSVVSANSIIGLGILADFGLSTLADNGGPTQTMALLPESSLIDVGDNANCPAKDQRGILRPQGSHCDMGAFEYYDGIIAEGQTVRASVNSIGGQGWGYEASISADGRYVAFTSVASDLVPNDTNGAEDVFVHDTLSGITIRASMGSQPEDNGQLGCCSSYPSISADGRYVAFQNSGTIIVRDMQMGVSTIVPGGSYHPFISSNGRFIVFDSSSTNLVSNDTNGTTDIFLRDLVTSTTTRVSVDSNGGQVNGNSTIPFVSADGRYVVFQSDATNLVTGDTNAQVDVFIHDMQTGVTTRASVDGNGGQANSDSSYASVSADGRYIAFQSNATNLAIGDTNTQSDIFVHDMQTGNTSRISIDSNGVQGNGSSNNSSIAADGRYIVFESNAANLVPNDTNGVTDTFVHDMQTGFTTRVSVDSNGAQGIVNPPCFPCYTFKLSVSADGSYIAFTSYASNLVPADTNSKFDVFVRRQNISTIPPTPTSTPVSTLTNTSTPMPTSTLTFTPTFTPTLIPTQTFTPTFTPTDTLTPTSTPTFTPTYTPTNTFTPTVTPPYSYNPLYASFGSSGTLSGVSFANEDILSFDGSTWSMYMDGSDVGLGGGDVEAFSIVNANTILMAFDKAITLNGISFAPTDIAKFSATSLGTNTAGTFSMYFHGSNVGFDTTSENIDAVDVLPDGRILLSTTGNVSVPNVSGVDEDILAFTPTNLGSTTSGTWAMYFDGSDVGLADASSEDTDVVDVGPDGKIYLSTLGSFTVNGATGAGEDVFVCTPGSLGNTTACTYSPNLYFDGSTWGLAGNNLDGFNLWTSGAVPSATPINTLTPTATSTSPSPTATFTQTATFTATSTNVASPTNTYTATATYTPSNTPTLGPSATSTYTATSTVMSTKTNTPTMTATATFIPSSTFTASPTASSSDVIFANGFESGYFSGWTSSSTNGGNLNVSPNAALIGSYGMQVLINSTTAMYARDDSPAAEARYRARFYFNPNSISISTSDYTYPLEGRDSANNIVLRVQFKRSSAGYQLGARAYDSVLANWVSTPLVTISNATHVVELDWGNDGHLNFWVDGVRQGSLTGINNAIYNIDSVRLGATYITTTVSGTYYIDAFESRRQTYIGP